MGFNPDRRQPRKPEGVSEEQSSFVVARTIDVDAGTFRQMAEELIGPNLSVSIEDVDEGIRISGPRPEVDALKEEIRQVVHSREKWEAEKPDHVTLVLHMKPGADSATIQQYMLSVAESVLGRHPSIGMQINGSELNLVGSPADIKKIQEHLGPYIGIDSALEQ